MNMNLPQDQFKPVVILLYVVTAVSIWKYFSIPIPLNSIGSSTGFWLGSYKLFGAFFLFGLVPMLLVKFLFRERLADYGLRFGIPLRTVRSFLLASPFIVLIAVLTGHHPAFYDVYPFNEAIRPQNFRIGYGIFAIHAVLYIGYYFGWEFLFRGFLQHGISERCGAPTAVLVQTLASTMLHYGHPASEVFGSIIAGIVWGTLSFRTKSILSGFGQHALLGIVLDWTLIFSSRY
jgi:membrane protease YdiL (CAAX protease family)